MPTAYTLGTGAVVSDPNRTTTMLAVQNERSTLLVDCGGDVAPRLQAVGLDPVSIDALIVTHEHADHVAGFPLLMERLWLMGRRTPLPVYGIAPAIAQARRVHDAFDTSDWVDYPGFTLHEIDLAPRAAVLDDGGWRVTASPGTHAVPVVGLRLDDEASHHALAYSSDTAPSEAIRDLAHGAQLLIHEASGTGPVHTSAEQAAHLANDANVGRLLLVHVPPHDVLAPDLDAARILRPDVQVAAELGHYPF